MSNEWGLIQGEWKDGNSDLNRKLEGFILQNPEWVIYLRRDDRFKCPQHWDQASETVAAFGDVTCSFCRGLGVKTTLEVVPCRLERDRGTMAPVDGSMRDGPGYIDMNDVVADFPRWIAPDVNDMFIVAEWECHPSQIPRLPRVKAIRIEEIYRIKKTNAHWEREVAVINCGVELFPLERQKARDLIESTSKIIIRRGDEMDAPWKQGSWW